MDQPTPGPDETPSAPGPATDEAALDAEDLPTTQPSEKRRTPRFPRLRFRRRRLPQLGFQPSEGRSNEFWLAVVGLVATATAGIAGSVMTWYTSDQHDKQESERQKTNFTQSQQKEAYAGFANAATDLGRAVDVQVDAIINRYGYFGYTEALMAKADVNTSFTDLLHAMNLALLFGSPKVRDRANDVFNAAFQSRADVVLWDAMHPANDPKPHCPEVLEFAKKTVDQDKPRLDAAMDRFNDAAREDLKVPSLPPTSSAPPEQVPNNACSAFPP